MPHPIAEALRQEERDLYRSAFEANRSPAETIYQYATMRGYRAPAAAPAAPAAPPAGTPGTALGGQSRAPAATPTATDVVNSIQRGQSAAASLSKAGGNAPDTELTPQALADMSEEQFAKLFNELQESGNKDKLRALFGN